MVYIFQRRAKLAVVLAATSFCLIACGAAPPDDPNAKGADSPNAKGADSQRTINGTLLHSIKVGPKHDLEFYDFGHDQTAVHESFLVGESSVLEAVGTRATLSEMFEAIAKSTTVPATISQADNRAKAYIAERVKAGGRAPTAVADEGSDVASKGSALAAASPSSSASCSAEDPYQDSWGAWWFHDNYCNAYGWRDCQAKNWGWYNSGGIESYGGFSYRQMEGDFEGTGITSGGHYYCDWFGFNCNWSTDWLYTTQPRSVSVWTYSGDGKRRGSGESNCGHLHAATLWNT